VRIVTEKPKPVPAPTRFKVVVAAPTTLIEQFAAAMNRLDWQGRVETIRKLAAMTGLSRDFSASVFDEIYRLHAQDEKS
jgi:hypothetical protein